MAWIPGEHLAVERLSLVQTSLAVMSQRDFERFVGRVHQLWGQKGFAFAAPGGGI
jgi:hypothetical protein